MINSIASLAVSLQQTNTQMQVSTAMMAKMIKSAEVSGDQLVELLDAMPNPTNIGNQLDVMV